MEVYTLDALLRRTTVIDRFESCIWTERWQDKGDFELVVRSTLETRNLLKKGTLLAMNLSHRIMEVETWEDDVDSNGRRLLSIKGQSIEKILEDRVAKESLSNLTTSPVWTLTGTPGVVARKIFHDICVTGILDIADQVPLIFEGDGFLPASTISESIDPITLELEPVSVYTAIKEICDVWGLGFRLVREYDTSKLWFAIYAGSDRTTKQTGLPPVVFTPELDNLQNTSHVSSTVGAKNVAYVYSPVGFEMVFAPEVDPEIDGFDRRVLSVVADDITEETTDPSAAMIQRGKEALAKARAVEAFDGEINQASLYQPNRDYYLGDIVEVRNEDGVTNDMRVTELIYASDEQGERTYPTLALNVFITTGSWLSWTGNKVWPDYDETEFWDNQP